MIVAIVPAAGKSERMGQPKLLLPLGDRLVIEHVLDALARSPIARSFVVIPPGAATLRDVATYFDKTEAIQLDQPTPDMRSSILAGLAHVELTIRGDEQPVAFLIALADQPTISPHIVRCLIDTFRRDHPSIVVPTHGGRNGHPVLFAWNMVPHVRSIPADRGLNALISQGEHRVAAVPIDAHECLQDLDTPADYERLVRGLRVEG